MPTPSKFPNKTAKGDSRIVATYDYRGEDGKLLFQVVWREPKDFRQRRPKPDGGWDWSVKGVRVVPYRLPQLLAEPMQPLVVVEGEKDADNLAGIGLLATCNAGGAAKWSTEHAAFLRGRTVSVLADNDEAGRNHAQQVAQSLHGIAESVRIVELPGLPDKGDVNDWIAAGGTKDELQRLIAATPAWTPAASMPWPEIMSFDDANLPTFPTDALPPVLRQWVESESYATQTPADLGGLLALAVCSSTIARHVVVNPRPGFSEPANLFMAVLLEPGNRKSAVFGDAIKPLREIEAELIEAARPTVAREQSSRRQNEARLKRLEKLAVEKNDPAARDEAGKLAADLAEQVEPALPRLMVDDATSEKLAMMLAEQGGRIASMSPEGGVFDLMAGLYTKDTPQFGVYLMGHSGDDLVTDRVSRESVRVVRPALTYAYAMQPAVIEGLAENPAFRGRGLLARFLYATPRSWIGRQAIAPPPVPDVVRDAYRDCVRTLASNYAGLTTPIELQFDADASIELIAWEAELESMLGDGGLMEVMRDWGSKLAGATVRLAAVLHCVEHHPLIPVDGTTFAAAVKIARYLIPHADVVLNMMQAREGAGDDDAKYVLNWIKRHRYQEFTKRDAQQHGKRRFPKVDDINPALAALTRRGYIRLRPAEATGPGRPASPAYEVNPAVIADELPADRSRPVLPLHCIVSENIESASQHSENSIREQVTI